MSASAFHIADLSSLLSHYQRLKCSGHGKRKGKQPSGHCWPSLMMSLEQNSISLPPVTDPFQMKFHTFDDDIEVIEYLKLGSKMKVLNHFPIIKAVLLTFKTATPPTAPVETLPSPCNLVLPARRNRLCVKQFERLF